LVVAGRREAKLNRCPIDGHRGRQEIARVELGTVRGDRIDLAAPVATVDQPFTAAPTRAAADDDIPVPCRPLALDTKQVRTEVEDEIVSLVVKRTRDPDPEPHRDPRDCGFSEQALLIGRQFAQHVDGSASLGRAVS
jgi:hypothetical protein